MPNESELQIAKAELLPQDPERVLGQLLIVRLWFSRPVSEVERDELQKRYNFGVSESDPTQATIAGQSIDEVSSFIGRVNRMLAAVADGD
jgi:hypothetical protein